MKSTGIIRQLDKLGRVCLPIELRRTLSIGVKDGLEIFIEEDTIILRRYEPLCYICRGSEELKNFKGKKVCMDCVNEAQRYK